MPVIKVKREVLFDLLGKRYTDEEFSSLCFRFGLELEEITSEKKIAAKERGLKISDLASDEIIYKIDVPTSRNDFLSLEGIAQAIKMFEGLQPPPNYVTNRSRVEFHVDAHALSVRPILVGAVVRDLKLTQDVYDSFIDLQDKIHQNLGRKRSLVSIGTHDLDKVQGPFYYTACPPNELKFVPLNHTEEFTGLELMDLYADSHLKQYLPLIKDKPRYPLIYDKNKVVLSMPPIINGDTSKITLDTRNVLIEITATNLWRATIALDTIVTMLVSSAAAQNKYQAESVTIYTGSEERVTPNLDYYKATVDRDYFNKSMGADLSGKEISELLLRMGYKAKSERDSILIEVPPTRHDVIDKQDVMSDATTAYGLDNIRGTVTKSWIIPTQKRLNKLVDALRLEILASGYTQVQNSNKCSKELISATIRDGDEVDKAVILEDTRQVARTSLIPGILQNIQLKPPVCLPVKLFEIGDVYLKAADDSKAKHEVRLAAAFFNDKGSGLEVVHGLLDRIMKLLGIPHTHGTDVGYYLKPTDRAFFLPGRCASIICRGKSIGYMGTVHPEVVINLQLKSVCSAFEIRLEEALNNIDRIEEIINRGDILEFGSTAFAVDNEAESTERGIEDPFNKLTGSLREEMRQCGYTGAYTFTLCSENQISTMIQDENGLNDAIIVQNPKSSDCQVARTCLITGLLLTIQSNSHVAQPIKIYEVDDVILRDDRYDVRARNERRVAAVIYGRIAVELEHIKGLLQRIMQFLSIPHTDNADNEGYYLVSSDNGLYLTGSCASIMFRGKAIGYIGTIHPEVIDNFKLKMPCSGFEFQLEEVSKLKRHRINKNSL